MQNYFLKVFHEIYLKCSKKTYTKFNKRTVKDDKFRILYLKYVKHWICDWKSIKITILSEPSFQEKREVGLTSKSELSKRRQIPLNFFSSFNIFKYYCLALSLVWHDLLKKFIIKRTWFEKTKDYARNSMLFSQDTI